MIAERLKFIDFSLIVCGHRFLTIKYLSQVNLKKYGNKLLLLATLYGKKKFLVYQKYYLENIGR